MCVGTTNIDIGIYKVLKVIFFTSTTSIQKCIFKFLKVLYECYSKVVKTTFGKKY